MGGAHCRPPSRILCSVAVAAANTRPRIPDNIPFPTDKVLAADGNTAIWRRNATVAAGRPKIGAESRIRTGFAPARTRLADRRSDYTDGRIGAFGSPGSVATTAGNVGSAENISERAFAADNVNTRGEICIKRRTAGSSDAAERFDATLLRQCLGQQDIEYGTKEFFFWASAAYRAVAAPANALHNPISRLMAGESSRIFTSQQPEIQMNAVQKLLPLSLSRQRVNWLKRNNITRELLHHRNHVAILLDLGIKLIRNDPVQHHNPPDNANVMKVSRREEERRTRFY